MTIDDPTLPSPPMPPAGHELPPENETGEPTPGLRLVVSNGPVAASKPKEPAPRPKVGSSLADLVTAFTKLPAWHQVIGWNEFTYAMVFRREPPFRHAEPLVSQAVGEEDVVRIRHWLEVEHQVQVSGKTVLDALQIVSRQNRFHPVRDYLGSLSWDGQPRVDGWLEEFCSVKPTSPEHRILIQAVSRKWLISCVARAMTPGCKVDTMLILEGKQGIGKSSLLRALAGEDFFCDAHIEFGSTEACQTVQGAWIYELPELDAILRGDSASTKAFLSRPRSHRSAVFSNVQPCS